jgi:hypothetical protein
VYAQHRAAKADIAEELTMRPWGVRQYVVRETNGYLLKVAESQKEEAAEKPATKWFATPVSVHSRALNVL